MKSSFLPRPVARFEGAGEAGKIERAEVLRHGARLPDGEPVGFEDDTFSAYLDLISRWGPDSPLRFERYDTSRFSVVDMTH